MAAEIAARGQTLEVGRIQKLFGSVITTVGYLYDVSLDGSRFIVAQEGAETGAAARPPLTLVENWTGLLTRRRPAGGCRGASISTPPPTDRSSWVCRRGDRLGAG